MKFKDGMVGIFVGIALATLAAACSQTAAPAPNIIERAQGETPAPPPPSGFLGKGLLSASTGGRRLRPAGPASVYRS
jgi:hypothetical protein